MQTLSGYPMPICFGSEKTKVKVHIRQTNPSPRAAALPTDLLESKERHAKMLTSIPDITDPITLNFSISSKGITAQSYSHLKGHTELISADTAEVSTPEQIDISFLWKHWPQPPIWRTAIAQPSSSFIRLSNRC